MATVRDILATKQLPLISVGPEASVYDAVVVMNDHRVGSVLVSESGRLLGIFTERDLLRRVVGERRDAVDTKVHEVMTTEVACCQLKTTLEEARGVMKNRRIRHLPVVDDAENVIGLVSIGDLNAQEDHSREMTIHLLQQYIAGQV